MKKSKNNWKKKLKSPGTSTILIIAFFILIAYGYSYATTMENEEPTVSEVVASIKGGEVESIVTRGRMVEINYKEEGRVGELLKDPVVEFVETLSILGVTQEELSLINYSVEKEKGFGVVLKTLLPFLFPILLLLVFFWFLSSQSKGMGGGMQVFSFGKSRARFVDPKDKKNRITFKDVEGSEETKQELYEFVEFLKHPDKFLNIGARVPKGVLLTGPPGTGKTLLARAIAGEAGVPFFSISGSEFVEMFVGVGASRVRDLFLNAKTNSPAIIFIDEIDAVGRARGSGLGGGNDEREQALNQILVEMDGFERSDKVVVIAATNRADILDKALLRQGRFDRKVVVDLPDIKERANILKIHLKNKKVETTIDTNIVAKRTPGLSGADLESVVNEAGILAVRDNRTKIAQNDLLKAIEKVILGPERKGRVITDHEKKVIAYHEAGHALLASLLPYSDPVQKITIVSRGHAGGYVLSLPDVERRLKTRKEFVDTITMALGGYVTEELIFGDISTGPSSDLMRVTELAHSMVTRFGMSSKVGPQVLRLPTGFGTTQKHADAKELEIDKEIDRIVKGAYDTAKKLLKANRKILDSIVDKLLEVETLEREEFEKLLKEQGVEIKNEFNK